MSERSKMINPTPPPTTGVFPRKKSEDPPSAGNFYVAANTVVKVAAVTVGVNRSPRGAKEGGGD